MPLGDQDTRGLLDLARQGDVEALGRLLEIYRASLRTTADRQVAGRLGARFDGSDIVQATFLDAHQGFAQFRGTTEIELEGWLRSILDNNVAGVIRDNVDIEKRTIKRELSLDESDSAGRQRRDTLAAGESTASRKAVRNEEHDRLERAIASLPADQQTAVRLRHLQRRSVAAIAAEMQKTEVAVASLIKRGIKTLREKLKDARP